MTVTRIRGYALPDGDYVDLYADGDRWTTDAVPGVVEPGEPLDEGLARRAVACPARPVLRRVGPAADTGRAA